MQKKGVVIVLCFVLMTSFVSAELISHYEFDGGPHDSVGINHFSRDMSLVEGKIGSAGGFDGDDDYQKIFNFQDLPSNQISLAMWIEFDEHRNYQTLITHEWQGEGSWILYDGDDKKIRFGIASDAKKNLVYSAELNEDRWYHVSGTYDGSTMKLYVDGILVGSRALNDAILDGTGHVEFGGRSSSGNNKFNGALDDVRIYDSALSASEVADLAGVGGGGDECTSDLDCNSNEYCNFGGNCILRESCRSVVPSSATENACLRNRLIFGSDCWDSTDTAVDLCENDLDLPGIKLCYDWHIDSNNGEYYEFCENGCSNGACIVDQEECAIDEDCATGEICDNTGTCVVEKICRSIVPSATAEEECLRKRFTAPCLTGTESVVSSCINDLDQPGVNLCYSWFIDGVMSEHYEFCEAGCVYGECAPSGRECSDSLEMDSCLDNSNCYWDQERDVCGGGVGIPWQGCSDPDGGKNYYVEAHTFGFREYSSSSDPERDLRIRTGGRDACLERNTLREHYCAEGKFIRSKEFACEEGCFEGKCLPEIGQCVGCELDFEPGCVPYGTRMEDRYCTFEMGAGTGGTLVLQKGTDAFCDNGYECISDVCTGGRCAKTAAEEVGGVRKFFCRLFSTITFGGVDYGECIGIKVTEFFKFEKPNNLLNVGESLHEITPALDDDDLPNVLAKVNYEDGHGNTSRYIQKIVLGENLTLQEDFSDRDYKDGELATGIPLGSADIVLRYKLDFPFPVVFSSLEEEQLTIMGRRYLVTSAEGITLILEDTVNKNVLTLKSNEDILLNGDIIEELKSHFSFSFDGDLQMMQIEWTTDEDEFITEESSLMMPALETLQFRFEGMGETGEGEVYGEVYLDGFYYN
jgi:hypothetical protein